MANNTDWLEISQMSGGTGMTPLSLTALTNSSLQPKTATITARNTQYNVSDTTTVTIQGFQPTLTLSTSTLRFDSTGGTATFTVYSNTAWTIDFPYLVYDYSTSAGTGDTEVTIVLDQNLDTVSKVQVGTVRDIFGVNELSLTIVQEAFIHQLTVTPDDDIVFDNTGSTTSLTIDSNCDWVIYTSSWMRLSVNSGTSGTTTVLVTALQNGPEDREGVIAIYYGNKEILINTFQPFYIPDHITVTPSAYTFPYSVSEATFVVDSYPGWTCEVVTTGETIWAADAYMEAVFDIPSAMTMPAYTGNSGSTTAIYIGPIKHYGSSVTFESGGTYRIRYEMPSGGTTPVLQGNQYLKEVTITDNVGAIQSSAFTGCSALSSVTIGSGLTGVGNGAFSGCSSLDFIKITAPTAPSVGSNTFYGVATGGTLVYPEDSNYSSWLSTDKSYLGYYFWNDVLPTFRFAFTVTYNVTSTGNTQIMPNWASGQVDYVRDSQGNITPLDDKTAYWFSSTGKQQLDLSITESYASDASIELTGMSNITDIQVNDVGQYKLRLSGTTSVTGLTLYKNLSLSNGNLNNIKYLKITGSTTTVPGIGKTKLTRAEVFGNVTSLPNNAFSGATGLTSITLSDNITSLGDNCFNNCSGITSLTLPSGVTNIGSYAFCGCTSWTGPAILANGATELKTGVFCDCSSLSAISIPDSVTKINTSALTRCSSISSFTIPDKVDEITTGLFTGCYSLSSLTIGTGMTSVHNAFNDCSALTSITIYATTAPWTNGGAFSGVGSNGILYYPAGSDYSVWLGSTNKGLGSYGWTGQQI